MVQAHIYFVGTVQGVGFRYTTLHFARDLELTGWVRNLSDGRVEILAEGPQDKIETLVKKLADHFGSYIKDKQLAFQPPQGTFKEFQITHA